MSFSVKKNLSLLLSFALSLSFCKKAIRVTPSTAILEKKTPLRKICKHTRHTHTHTNTNTEVFRTGSEQRSKKKCVHRCVRYSPPPELLSPLSRGRIVCLAVCVYPCVCVSVRLFSPKFTPAIQCRVCQQCVYACTGRICLRMVMKYSTLSHSVRPLNKHPVGWKGLFGSGCAFSAHPHHRPCTIADSDDIRYRAAHTSSSASPTNRPHSLLLLRFTHFAMLYVCHAANPFA